MPVLKLSRRTLYVGEEVCIRGVSVGNVKERGQLVDLDVNGAITLKWILKKQAGRPWTELEFRVVVDYLRNCQLLKQDCAP